MANGDSITGVSALNYLDSSAMMGLGGDQCRNLSPVEIDKIRVDMATGYLDTLYRVAQDNGGTVARDVKYKELKAFHQQGFERNSLSLDNWTLNTPMELIRREYGDATVEAIWELMRDSGGTGFDAWTYSTNLLWYVWLRTDSSGPVNRDMARQWMQFFDEGGEMVGPMFDAIGETVNELFRAAISWVTPRRDPLALDLDGDGIETIGIGNWANTTLFDHDGDGVKDGTGWLSGDDGWLVRDLDGNGSIDSGAELFGENTVLANGNNATDGFSALADLDSNGDGKIDVNDAAFGELKVWQDANRNGISQAGELSTLSERGIAAIDLSATEVNNNQNGNTIVATASYTRSDGSTGTAGTVDAGGTAGSLNLDTSTFYSEFADAVAGDASLPEMQRTGMLPESGGGCLCLAA